MTTELAQQNQQVETVAIKPNMGMATGPRGLKLETLSDLAVFADKASRTELVPTAYRGKPADILVAIQMGAEVGLSPMASLKNIAVINGRASLYGDGFLAVAKSAPVFDHSRFDEGWSGTGDSREAYCECARIGGKVVRRTFSVADAKAAKLWGKQGPWSTNADRMLQMRARGFAIRDCFADVLAGFVTFEEARDIAETEGETLVAVQAPPPPKLESLADRAEKLAKGKKAAAEPVAQPEPAEAATVQPEPENAPESPQPPLPGKLATTAQVNKLADLVLKMPAKVATEFKQRWNIEKAVRLTVTAWDTNRTEDCIGDAEAVLELAKG